MAVLKNNHTHVTSQDLQKAAEFYTKILGAKLVADRDSIMGRIIDVELGGMPIHITSTTGADKNWANTGGLHHLAFEVDDMDEFAAKMKTNGVEFITEPSTSPSGRKVTFIKGPDNVLFEILEIGK